MYQRCSSLHRKSSGGVLCVRYVQMRHMCWPVGADCVCVFIYRISIHMYDTVYASLCTHIRRSSSTNRSQTMRICIINETTSVTTICRVSFHTAIFFSVRSCLSLLSAYSFAINTFAMCYLIASKTRARVNTDTYETVALVTGAQTLFGWVAVYVQYIWCVNRV